MLIVESFKFIVPVKWRFKEYILGYWNGIGNGFICNENTILIIQAHEGTKSTVCVSDVKKNGLYEITYPGSRLIKNKTMCLIHNGSLVSLHLKEYYKVWKIKVKLKQQEFTQSIGI